MDRDGARIAELDGEIEPSKGSIHSQLATHQEHGFVSKEGAVYHVGFDCLTLGGYARDRHPLYAAGRTGADELAREIGELTCFVIRNNGSRRPAGSERNDEARDRTPRPDTPRDTPSPASVVSQNRTMFNDGERRERLRNRSGAEETSSQ